MHIRGLERRIRAEVEIRRKRNTPIPAYRQSRILLGDGISRTAHARRAGHYHSL